MLTNQTLNTRSNSRIIVYNISLQNENGKLGSKNQKGDTYIFFVPAWMKRKNGKPGYCNN
jgi:hypothetical protein